MAAADQLAADLIGRGHRVIAGTDAIARIAVGNEGAGADWAAELIARIRCGARGTAPASIARSRRAWRIGSATSCRDSVAVRGVPRCWSSGVCSNASSRITASDATRAKAWLYAAAAVGSSLELDPLSHPEDERDVFARARAVLHNEAPGTLSVATTPAAAEVWVDGVRRCASPCSVTLVPGRHFVRATSPAHAPAAAQVDLDVRCDPRHGAWASPLRIRAPACAPSNR